MNNHPSGELKLIETEVKSKNKYFTIFSLVSCQEYVELNSNTFTGLKQFSDL